MRYLEKIKELLLSKIKKYKKVRFFLLKTKKYKRKNPASFWSIVITLSVSLFFVLIYSINFTELSDDPAVWGTFGDYIGGIVGTVIAFLVFIATREIINLQKQELKETREELKKSSNAQELQAKLLQQQYFDNTFFSWLKRLKEQVDLSDKEIKITNDGIDICENIGIKIYPILNRMYNNLETSTLDNENKNKNKKEYSDIIRSYLTKKVLEFILIDNCDKEIKNIIEQYALLKNLEHNTRYCEKEYERYFLNYKISAFEGHRMFMPYRISLEENPEELAKYAEYSDIKVRQAVAENANTPTTVLKILSKDNEDNIRKAVATNQNTPEKVLNELVTNDKSNEVRISALGNSNISAQILDKELQNKYNEINDKNINEIIYIIFSNSQIYDDNTKFNTYFTNIIEYMEYFYDKDKNFFNEIIKLKKYFNSSFNSKIINEHVFKNIISISIDNILNNKYQYTCYHIIKDVDIKNKIYLYNKDIHDIISNKTADNNNIVQVSNLTREEREERKQKITSKFTENENILQKLKTFISQLKEE